MLGFVRAKGLARFALGARAASTVGATLEEAVERLPHKEALRSVKQDIRWSFKELNEVVDEFAHGLQSLQFQPGDVLAVWLPNNAESVVTQLAAAKAGVTLAVIEPEISTAAEVEYILHDSKASGILFEPKIAGRNQTKIIQGLLPELDTFRENYEVLRNKRFRHLHTVMSTNYDYVEGILPFRQAMVNSPEPHVMAAVKKTLNEKTPLAVAYSKVEGQNPKKSGVITHGDLLKRASELSKKLSLTSSDKILLTGQDGVTCAPLAAIEHSSLVVLPSAEFNEEAVKYAQQLESCSIVGSAEFKRV